MTLKVSVDLHPKYYHDLFGSDFGEQSHRDPFLRAREFRRTQQLLHEKYGRYGAIFPAPAPEDPNVLDSVSIQPLDFLNAALGGRLEFRCDEAVWTPDRPLKDITTLQDVENLPEIDWDKDPLYCDFLRQFALLQEAKPNGKPTGMQCAWLLQDNDAILITHTGYTTGFRLMGDTIFDLMLFEPETAQALFAYIFRQYRNQALSFCKKFNWQLTKVHFGDCAATMLSPDLFREVELPSLIRELEIGNYRECTQHSCGPSTHLLECFREIPKLTEVQLGYGTDLAKARKCLPDVRIIAFYSAAAMLRETPEEITRNVPAMAEQMGENYLIAGSAFDPATPEKNLEAFFAAAQKLNEA